MKPQSTKIRTMKRLGQALARGCSARSGNLIGALFAASLLVIAPLTHAASCTINSVSNLNFGGYDPFASTALDMATTASIYCTSTKSSETVTVAISLGTGSAGSFSPRTMRSATDSLNYNLYVDAAHAQVLGDGTGGTFKDIGSATISKSSPFTFIETIYGRIFAGQDPAVGTYSDPITYTLNF